MGAKRTLNGSQQDALARVAERTERIQEKERWIEEIRERELHPLEAQRDALIFEAVTAGVPKNWIYTQQILGTVNPYAVEQAIQRHLARRGAASPEITEIANGRFRLAIRAFATTSNATDYPEVLAGVVERDETSPSGFSVISDETDQVIDGVRLDGHLRWEMQRPATEYDSVAAYIERELAARALAA